MKRIMTALVIAVALTLPACATLKTLKDKICIHIEWCE